MQLMKRLLEKTPNEWFRGQWRNEICHRVSCDKNETDEIINLEIWFIANVFL